MEDFAPELFTQISGFAKYEYAKFLKTEQEAKQKLSDQSGEISVESRNNATNLYTGLMEFCTRYGMRASLATVKKILAVLKKEDAKYAELYAFGDELSGRIEDELSEARCLILDVSEADLYDDPLSDWGDAPNNFPSAVYDMEEAARCLALQRSTASAFHSIRSLEAAIRAISRCLNIPDPTRAADRNWGAVLQTVKNELDKRWPTSSTRMSGDGEFFDSAYAALAAMQNPWRNATMHLDQMYTPKDARHLIEIIKGFMRKIASRCDENGLPKA